MCEDRADCESLLRQRHRHDARMQTTAEPHTLSSEGLLCAARATRRDAPSALQAFLVAPSENIEAQSEAEAMILNAMTTMTLPPLATMRATMLQRRPETRTTVMTQPFLMSSLHLIPTTSSRIFQEKHNCSRKAPVPEMIGCIAARNCRTWTIIIIPATSTGSRCLETEVPQVSKRGQEFIFCSTRTTHRASNTSKCYEKSHIQCKLLDRRVNGQTSTTAKTTPSSTHISSLASVARAQTNVPIL